jgi:hypothetical protein
VGGPSHQNAAEMEARIAQMSRDMEVLTQQNLCLQRRPTDERVPEASKGHGEEESNTQEEGDRESWRALERSWTDNQSRQEGGVENPLTGRGEDCALEGVVNPPFAEKRLNEAMATLDEKYEEKYNRL